LTFGVTRDTFCVENLTTELRGYSVSLESVLVWAVREFRFHNQCSKDDNHTIEFSLKLDGRPLAGS